MKNNDEFDFDYVIIGSGFGGSVSALRLTEKGYKVLVLEQGKRLQGEDFPKSNWNVKKWLWLPVLRFYGLFKITMFKHITVLSGAGVGGGSLVYANSLPVPKKRFFTAKSWAHLADWETELKEFYPVALKMLGANPNPRMETGDLALQQLAREIGKEEHFSPTDIAVYFGKADVSVKDPYFGGAGPDRKGCTFCGGCMLGCRHDAKNTLDKNYLYLAEKGGAQIQAESAVYDVLPLDGNSGSDGYLIKWKKSTSLFPEKGEVRSKGVIFSGGVMGTVKLLLKLKKSSLPNLSPRVGYDVRTNSESLLGITSTEKDAVFSDGVAIGSILLTDEFSHLEPVRYPEGSGFWRILMSPLAFGKNIFVRIMNIFKDILKAPLQNLKVYFVNDWAKKTQILLFMRTLDTTLKLSDGRYFMKSSVVKGEKPTPFVPEAKDLAERYGKIINGKPTMLLTETLAGIPTTAHILGGSVMGSDISQGVIDKNHKVFGYENMLICDGSAISANPGVNPSLTITTLTERAMSKIAPKNGKFNKIFDYSHLKEDVTVL